MQKVSITMYSTDIATELKKQPVKNKIFGHSLFFRDCYLNPKNSDDFEITCKTNTLKKPSQKHWLFPVIKLRRMSR